jgi:NAD(P)H-flavin reductase
VRTTASSADQIAAGVFFLARCESGDPSSRAWETYLRRPLFPIHSERTPESTQITLMLPQRDDAGYGWLRARSAGDSIDLTGPHGNGFSIENPKPNLILAADLNRVPLLNPLIDAALDRGGRVALLVRAQEAESEEANRWLGRLPFAVEARAEAPAHFMDALAHALAWADQFCVSFPFSDYAALARLVRANRMRPLPRFAQALVTTDFPCGVGACLACVVPLARGGHTRACKHGPVFDLLALG